MENSLVKEVVAKLHLEPNPCFCSRVRIFRKSSTPNCVCQFAKKANREQNHRICLPKRVLSLPLKTLLFLTLPLYLAAHVEHPEVVAGSATFTKPDVQTQVIEAADKTAINCKTFNIGKDETVRFVQPHHKARVLCRVTGKEASILKGRLEANGHLFLINPNSIVFRPTAQINAKTLVASTLDIKDADFVDGKYKFVLSSHAKDSAIVNRGSITADNVVFMAPQIVDEGIVHARVHRWSLGGEMITLSFDEDNLISFAIDTPLQKGFIVEGGQNTGAEVFIKLSAAQELIKSVVNVNGLIEATTVRNENGKVYLVASSQTAKSFKVEAPLIETAADFTVGGKVEMTAEKELKWSGGNFTPVLETVNKKKVPMTELSLNSSHGTLIVDASIDGSKNALKKLTLNGKIIDQNNSVKCTGPTTYTAEKTFLGGDIYAPNSDITFNGPVIIDNDIFIKSGLTRGNILFNATLDADHSNRNLTIIGSYIGKGSIFIKGPIGLTGLLNLKIEGGKISLPNIGDKNRAGVGHLEIKTKMNESMDFSGTIIHASQQTWEVENINLKSRQPTTFITDGNSMIFTSTKINLDPHTSLFFDTRGGNIELPSIFGNHHQSITINTRHGDTKIGELSGRLGHLLIQSRNIHFDGPVEVGSAYLEAKNHICYTIDSEGNNFRYPIISKGNITLNAKRGMIGTPEMPIYVKAKGKIYAGSKSFAYLKGECEDGFPSPSYDNPPPRLIFNDFEIVWVPNE